MNSLQQVIIERFGNECVNEVEVQKHEIPLLLINPQNASKTRILTTIGLSDYLMPVPEKMKGREFNELYFCLPSYWDIDDTENPRLNWVFHWIQRLAKHVIEKNTWFGPGHTIPCGNPFVSLSDTMKQNHFILCDPMLLEKELQPFHLEGKEIHFLSILPIFEDEMDYKQGKGTAKLLQKMVNHGITEKLDDFRGSVLKRRWSLFKK